MSNLKNRREEESGRKRNNENGEHYPTPKEDEDTGVSTRKDWTSVRKIFDHTTDTDSTHPDTDSWGW